MRVARRLGVELKGEANRGRVRIGLGGTTGMENRARARRVAELGKRKACKRPDRELG
jgi:hypothetical protein